MFDAHVSFQSIFSGIECTGFTESSHERIFFRDKKIQKSSNFKAIFLNLKRKSATEKTDKIGTSIPCSTTYFLEVDAQVSLKVSTKGSFIG